MDPRNDNGVGVGGGRMAALASLMSRNGGVTHLDNGHSLGRGVIGTGVGALRRYKRLVPTVIMSTASIVGRKLRIISFAANSVVERRRTISCLILIRNGRHCRTRLELVTDGRRQSRRGHCGERFGLLCTLGARLPVTGVLSRVGVTAGP